MSPEFLCTESGDVPEGVSQVVLGAVCSKQCLTARAGVSNCSRVQMSDNFCRKSFTLDERFGNLDLDSLSQIRIQENFADDRGDLF